MKNKKSKLKRVGNALVFAIFSVVLLPITLPIMYVKMIIEKLKGIE